MTSNNAKRKQTIVVEVLQVRANELISLPPPSQPTKKPQQSP